MNENLMFGYKVTISQYCNESHRSEEAYGDWYESYTNSAIGVEKIEKYPDCASVENLIQGNPVHVVWAEWSSGDSFGNSDRGSVEAIAVFSKWEDARGLYNAITDGDDNDKCAYKFVASTGQVFESTYAPWSGYFEHLDSVNIDTMFLQ